MMMMIYIGIQWVNNILFREKSKRKEERGKEEE
jgi:hypothetical protein